MRVFSFLDYVIHCVLFLKLLNLLFIWNSFETRLLTCKSINSILNDSQIFLICKFYGFLQSKATTKYRKQISRFAIVTRNSVMWVKLTCSFSISSKQEQFRMEFMGFHIRYLTNNHRHSNIALYLKHHEKSFKHKMTPW
jgi:hypothetical protein